MIRTGYWDRNIDPELGQVPVPVIHNRSYILRLIITFPKSFETYFIHISAIS